MTIELTDQARYDLEKENIINVILAAVRSGKNPTDQLLKETLKIDQPTLVKLKAKLKADKIIK